MFECGLCKGIEFGFAVMFIVCSICGFSDFSGLYGF